MSVAFKGAGKRLETTDIPRVAHEIGVGEDLIHALVEVEASGRGFDDKKRLKALYEPHVAYRCSSGAARKALVDAGLAYKDWKPGAYPKDSYPRILAAMAIDTDAALKATSWGLAQILGENFKDAGYGSVRAMIADFIDDEDNHLEAMIRFCKSKGIDTALRAIQAKVDAGEAVTADDWRPVALRYNGKGYAKHNYHGRLNAAFARWLKVKDTPYGAAIDVLERAEVEQAVHDAAPPVLVEEEKTGITETTHIAQGLTLTGIAAAVWEAIQSAPASLLQFVMERPTIILFALVAIALGFIFARRRRVKQRLRALLGEA